MSVSSSQEQLFPEPEPPRFRLAGLTLQNIKGIDKLTLDFPLPSLAGDPDVFVLGSRNGVGKTTVLEACALLILAALDKEVLQDRLTVYAPGSRQQSLEDLLARLVRAGERSAQVNGEFSLHSQQAVVELGLREDGKVTTSGTGELFTALKKSSKARVEDGALEFALLLAGVSSDPVLAAPVLYFHSFRKVQEGSQSFSSLTERGPRRWRGQYDVDSTVSIFKQELLRAMMGRANLFERLPNNDSDEVLEALSRLMLRYARGTVEKLLPQPDETFDFRVTPLNGGPSFSFDGLSSGQKEAISTMFLIWLHTRKQPSVVLIDEPELHLNPEWQRTFVRDLAQLAPNNQYILATHSEEIFASVQPEQRALLSRDDEAA